MTKHRQQINFLADDAVRAALDEIRDIRRPVVSISEAIRDAIINEATRLRARADNGTSGRRR